MPSKSVPVGADIVLIADSANGFIPSQTTMTEILSGNNLSTPFTLGPPQTLSNTLLSMPGYYAPANSTTQAQGMNFNTAIYLVPFFISQDFTISHLTTYCVTGAEAATTTLGIYASQPLPTGNPLVVGQAASTAQGVVSVALSLALSRNVIYWAAIQVSTNTTLSMQVAAMNLNAGSAMLTSASVGYIPASIGYVNTYSAGALPNINPASLAVNGHIYSPVFTIN